MKSALALLAVLLLAPPARAEIFVARGVFRFSFSDSAVVKPGEPGAELEVHPLGVRARYGVRRASRAGAFEQREVTVLGEPYDLNDADGRRWRMWIRAVAGPVVVVELIRPRKAIPWTSERFTTESVTVDGDRAAQRFTGLVLFPNGNYRLGAVEGRYRRDELGITLDGSLAAWGRGSWSLDYDTLTFRFFRHQRHFEVRFRLATILAAR